MKFNSFLQTKFFCDFYEVRRDYFLGNFVVFDGVWNRTQGLTYKAKHLRHITCPSREFMSDKNIETKLNLSPKLFKFVTGGLGFHSWLSIKT